MSVVRTLDSHGHGRWETFVTYMKNAEVVRMEMACLWNPGVLGGSLMYSESWMNQLKTMLKCGRRKLNESLNHASKL